ncbi:MAG: hypothetical protein IJN48_06570 [Clostridia bacterium]|nr:hypothetical protein [Clostridia bacterium]
MKKLRHYIFCTILIAVCLALTISAMATRSGEVVDRVLATNIRGFIDGYEIPSYNISNRLCIIAEDLRGYGFDVIWNAEERTLSVTQSGSGVTAPIDMSTRSKKNASMPVYSTDIVTYVNGEKVESFNIGGYTIIYLRELHRFGSCMYDQSCEASMVSTAYHSFKKVTLNDIPASIIHAGGEIDGILGSNSLEALEASYANGYRVIEIDFVLSSDGEPVCLHDWSKYYSKSLSETPITKAEFEKVLIFGKYTSMTFDSLANWMKEHPDVYIVTDIKENNVDVLRLMARKHPEIVSRIIPQIYQYEEYIYVRASGYSNIILTLYRLPTYEQKINAQYNATFASSREMLAVTADVVLAKDEFIKPFVANGMPLYFHTVNDDAKQQALISAGATGVYTDYAK